MCVSSKKAPKYRSYYYTVTFKIKKNPQGSYKFLKLILIVISFADDVCPRVIVSIFFIRCQNYFFAKSEWEGFFFCQVKFKTPTYVNDFTR